MGSQRVGHEWAIFTFNSLLKSQLPIPAIACPSRVSANAHGLTNKNGFVSWRVPLSQYSQHPHSTLHWSQPSKLYSKKKKTKNKLYSNELQNNAGWESFICKTEKGWNMRELSISLQSSIKPLFAQSSVFILSWVPCNLVLQLGSQLDPGWRDVLLNDLLLHISGRSALHKLSKTVRERASFVLCRQSILLLDAH